jgi:chromosome segregation ATPase
MMYDNRINELEETLNAATQVIDKMSEEIANLKEEVKEKNEWLLGMIQTNREEIISEFHKLSDEVMTEEVLRSAIREIQDEMKKKNRKLILIHEV